MEHPLILLIINVLILFSLTLTALILTVKNIKSKRFRETLLLKLFAFLCLILLWIVTMDEIIYEIIRDIQN